MKSLSVHFNRRLLSDYDYQLEDTSKINKRSLDDQYELDDDNNKTLNNTNEIANLGNGSLILTDPNMCSSLKLLNKTHALK
jgi:hypothetical protein